MAEDKDPKDPKVTPEPTPGDPGDPKVNPNDARITDLEKKLGEQGQELHATRAFVNDAASVIHTIYNDPSLRQQFQTTLAEQQQQGGAPGVVEPGQKPGQPPPTAPVPASPPASPSTETQALDRRVGRVEATTRETIAKDFEQRSGIDQLPSEDRDKVRKEVAEFMNTFGQSMLTVPIGVLGEVLDKAYVATHAEKLREEGRLEGFAQGRTNAAAAMPSMAGRSLSDVDPKPGLDAKQKKWAGALGVDEKKAAEMYLSQAEEQTRPSEIEKKIASKE